MGPDRTNNTAFESSVQRHFFSARQLSPALLAQLLQRASELPSGFYSTPWEILCVHDEDKKASLTLAAGNDPAIMEASDIIVFLADPRRWPSQISAHLHSLQASTTVTTQRADSLTPISFALDNRTKLSSRIKTLVTAISKIHKPWWRWHFSEAQLVEFALAHTKLVAANFVIEARLENIEAYPVEAFDETSILETLRIPASFHLAAIVCVGYEAQ